MAPLSQTALMKDLFAAVNAMNGDGWDVMGVYRHEMGGVGAGLVPGAKRT